PPLLLLCLHAALPTFPKNDLTLSVPYNFPVALLFRVAPPSDVVNLIVREIHRSDSIDNEAIVKWRGRVLNARWNEDMTVSLNCRSEEHTSELQSREKL